MANHTYLSLAEREINDEIHVGYTIDDSHGSASRFDWKDWDSFYAALPDPRAIWDDALNHADFGGADMLIDDDGNLLMAENNAELPAGTDMTPSHCYHFENTAP